MDESPLELYCQEMDKKYLDQGYMWLYYNIALKVDKTYFTALFLKDAQYRANHQRNHVISVEGQQGCQPAGSKVLMANGEFKNIENIKVGDYVLSPQENGKNVFAKVVNTLNFFSNENYSVYQKNKKHSLLYSCSYNHLIPVATKKAVRVTKLGKRKRLFDEWKYINVEAKDLVKRASKQMKCKYLGFSSFSIEKFKNVEDCKIEPYSLGVFLGDGCSFCYRRHGRWNKGLNITSNDVEIIEEISKFYEVMSVRHKQGTTAKSYAFSIQGMFAKQLQHYGLEGLKSGEKFIPFSAKCGSVEYRKRLLAGLIDTDGYYRCGGYSITSKSRQLVEDILFIVFSLGGRGQIRETFKQIKSIGFVGKYYDVSFYLHDLKLPVLLERKKKNIKSFYLDSQRVALELKKSESCQVFGITLEQGLNSFNFESQSGWYITDNFMITHNCGKSLFSQELGYIFEVIYNFPFDIAKDLFINPADLDHELRTGNNRRRTFVYDEQPKRNVGVGSRATQLALKDYEEICRYTQNNLIYCSPEVVEHSHYFIFRQVDLNPPRRHNPKCVGCVKYSECQKSFYSTLCDIPFNEREGYPLRFNFLLETKRLSDKMFMPRGIVSLPMVTPEQALYYNKIKGRNIERFENYENDSWKRQLKELDEFIEEYKDRLIKVKSWKGVDEFVPESKKVIEGWFYDRFSKQKYTTDEKDTLVDMARQKIQHLCHLKNRNA